MDWLEELREHVESYSTAPTLEGMPRLTLADKGIAGPTSAHRIEEIHTPLNFSYLTFTTGSSAFQNITGVTEFELDDRVSASLRALSLAGIRAGDHLLFTYPPLVNLFLRRSLEELGVTWSFLKVSSRDGLILALCEDQPRAVIGESSFLRATLESAKRMGLLGKLPRDLIFVAAGTPLDPELTEAAKEIGGSVHDLYGCQEFGWLVMDGIPLREDIRLCPAGDGGLFDLMVGGLPTGDRFPVIENGHILGGKGSILTYSRTRAMPELEVTIVRSTAHGVETLERLCRTILRIKAKILRVSPSVILGAEHTVLSAAPYPGEGKGYLITGSAGTKLFDSLLQAQLQYQAGGKRDETWKKSR